MLRPLPLTQHCASPLAEAEHVCIGVSPFNSYFTTERIADLARWAVSSFASFHFFVPDAPSAYTLEAIGYTPRDAARKAQRQGNYTRNKIHRALAQCAIDPGPVILDSAALEVNPMYSKLRTEAHHRFTSDPGFAKHCLSATSWVLEKRLRDAEPTHAQSMHAVRYFLAEMPMFVNTVEIAGVSSSVFAYHQRVPFLEKLFARELSWQPHPAQGFVVVEPVVAEQVAAESAL
ncbi:hypothetical protein [Alloactinosynnema sp. L-07]|nr:hypothetical protein [Alloactinosynnema sp. L-07]